MNIGIIPARMGSSRFPGKPLALLCGVPMIGHVYYRSCMSKALKDVYVATCDKEIQEYAASIGAKCIMTKETHERATERVAEATELIEKKTGSKVDIVVMIQGDEPMIYPQMIDEAVEPMLHHSSINITNLMAYIDTKEEHEDPNEVKVVVNQEGYALYFSREPIPSWKKCTQSVTMLKQVCVIPFRRQFLKKFITLKPTPLEKIESVDMLRALEHGYSVKMEMTQYKTYSVDTLEDLHYVEALLANDALLKKYAQQKKTRI